MEYTPRALAPLALLILFAAGAGGCSARSGYVAPSAADLYRERMRYEYEVRSQPQPVGVPAAIVTDLPELMSEPMPNIQPDAPALSETPPG